MPAYQSVSLGFESRRASCFFQNKVEALKKVPQRGGHEILAVVPAAKQA